MTISIADCADEERAKYAEIWSTIPEYRKYSPGLENVSRFMEVMKPAQGASLIDLGCGEGVAGLEFKKLGLDVWWLDITDAGLKPEVNRGCFIESPLWSDQWPLYNRMKWDYGFSCDVLEHIPTEYTMLVLYQMIQACRTLWLQISLVPDEFGKVIGEPLHLTVRPYNWWLVRLGTLGKVLDARDLCGVGLYVVGRK